jgi:hypothetical protein
MKRVILFLAAVSAISVAAQQRKPSKTCYIGKLTADGRAYLEPTRCSDSTTPSAKEKTTPTPLDTPPKPPADTKPKAAVE